MLLCIRMTYSFLLSDMRYSLYGELRGNLNLASRYDVDNFIQQAKDTPEALLSRMTGGVHLHTLHCPDAGSFERIKKELEEKGILYRKE